MDRLIFAVILLLLPVMAKADQQISLPGPNDIAQLAKQRAAVERFLAADSKAKYQTAVGKLGFLRALLEAKQFKKEDTHKLQCMGVILGDVFVQELGMEWIIVEDEYGRDPALRVPKTNIIIYPLTMISKRVEKGETIDVFQLFNGIAAQVDDLEKRN